MFGAIVDVGTMLNVIVASLLAGIGVSIAFSLAIVGATRFVDSRRSGHPIAAGAYGMLMALGLAASGAAVVFGVIVMTTK